jgi:MFS family permease
MADFQPAASDSPRAWLVSGATFLGLAITFGFLYAFGVFLRPMGLALGVSHAVMSTLFSFMSLLSYVLAPLTGELADHIGPRRVMLAGSLLFAAGLIGAAQSDSPFLAFPSLGIGVGAALACIYVPGIAAVGEWFKRYRAIALGIAISGIGAGTLVAAPLAASLIEAHGWRSTLQILGIGGGALLLASALLMFPPPIKLESKKGGRTIGAKVRTRQFGLIYSARALTGVPVFIALVYLPALAAAEGVSRVSAATLVSYIGGASILSRIGMNALAERYGAPLLFKVSCALVAAACVVWMYGHSFAALVVFSVLLGLAYGGVPSLTPAVAIQIFGLENIGELLGILLTSFGVAAVIGPPLAGIVVDRTHNYRDIVGIALAGALLSALAAAAIASQPKAAEAEAAEKISA